MEKENTCEHSGVTFTTHKLNNPDYKEGYNEGYIEAMRNIHNTIGNMIIMKITQEYKK